MYYYAGKKENKNKAYLKRFLIILVLIPLPFIIYVAVIGGMVINNADKLMRLPSEDFNHLAGNLMPKYENLRFTSTDGQTPLDGWFFKSPVFKSRANVVFVHNNRDNRLQFGLETSDFCSEIINQGFNLICFDLRHSGKSGGELSSYGYAEYADVHAAIKEIYLLTGQKEFILYGVGSGCTAVLTAWDKLDGDGLAVSKNEEENIRRSDIKAVILDTPTASGDDYIRADISNKGFMNSKYFRPYIPFAVRSAIGGSQIKKNLVPIATAIQAPMLIISNDPDNYLPRECIDTFINERMRLSADTTAVYRSKTAGHLSARKDKTDDYSQVLNNFLDRWFEYKEESSADDFEDSIPVKDLDPEPRENESSQRNSRDEAGEDASGENSEDFSDAAENAADYEEAAQPDNSVDEETPQVAPQNEGPFENPSDQPVDEVSQVEDLTTADEMQDQSPQAETPASEEIPPQDTLPREDLSSPPDSGRTPPDASIPDTGPINDYRQPEVSREPLMPPINN